MITSKLSYGLALGVLGLGLSGCGSSDYFTSSSRSVAVQPDLVSLRLAQSAEKASKALDVIAGIEQVRAPQLPAVEDYSMAPPALQQFITVRWNGPIEQIVEVLAGRAGMSFATSGQPAPVPILVTVDVYQKPLIEVLQGIGLQAGRRADLAVNAPNNVIEIRYAPVDRI
ncbi:MAG: DotD/TraH family lipoprotein [Alphaproteobacteria bacterium]|nr:DotD/TraH family lipoprotein [Alphaproteobacteria bacterium]